MISLSAAVAFLHLLYLLHFNRFSFHWLWKNPSIRASRLPLPARFKVFVTHVEAWKRVSFCVDDNLIEG